MEQHERQALVRRLQVIYPQFLIQDLYGLLRLEYLTEFDGEKRLKHRVRKVWIDPISWDTAIQQVGAWASSLGFLPITNIPHPINERPYC